MSSENTIPHTLYKSLFENSFSIMLLIDPENGTILDANKAAVEFYQYSRDEILGMNVSVINRASIKNLNQNIQHKNYFTPYHYLKNGDSRKVEEYIGSVNYNDKKIICSIIHDISERQKIEDNVGKNENTVRTMLNATTSHVYLTDLEGLIIDMNKHGAQLFNKTPDEMIGKNFKEFLPENRFAHIHSIAKQVVKTQESMRYQKDKDDRYYEISLYPVFDKNETVNRICVFVRDITDLKKTEKVFAAIETAGGICHEMNQPLQVILGNLEILKLNLRDDEANLKIIDILMNHTERLGRITKKLTHITRYETKEYIKGTIFDIDKSTQ